MTVPAAITFPATAAQIAAVRAKLNIPADQNSGSYDSSQAKIDWHIVAGGFEVDVMALKGFMASHAPESVVRAHIAEAIGLG